MSSDALPTEASGKLAGTSTIVCRAYQIPARSALTIACAGTTSASGSSDASAPSAALAASPSNEGPSARFASPLPSRPPASGPTTQSPASSTVPGPHDSELVVELSSPPQPVTAGSAPTIRHDNPHRTPAPKPIAL